MKEALTILSLPGSSPNSYSSTPRWDGVQRRWIVPQEPVNQETVVWLPS